MQEKWLSMVNKEKIEEYMRYALTSNEMPLKLPEFFWTDWADAKNSNNKFRELFKDSLKIKQKINFDLPISQRNNEPEYKKMENIFYEIRNEILSFFNSRDCRKIGVKPSDYVSNCSDNIIQIYDNSDTFSMILIDCLYKIINGDNKINPYQAGKYKAYQVQTKVKDDDDDVYSCYQTYEYIEKDKEIFTFSLREGERANKAFKRLARLVNLPQYIMALFEQLEIARSMLIQTSKMNATLVLSIDPEDFLTASDNSLNWDSCFSLTNEGCYKNGTYSAMVSPNLAIAYIESDRPFIPNQDRPEDTFSNKIWRAWVYIDDNIFFVNKNYPFYSETITSFLYNWLISTSSDIYVSSKDAKLSLHADSFMYNDTNLDDLFYIKNDVINIFPSKEYYIELSVAPRCLFCGESLEDNGRDGLFCCYDCDDIIYCDGCGEEINRDDAYWIDDMPLCRCCYEDEIEFRLEEERKSTELDYEKALI